MTDDLVALVTATVVRAAVAWTLESGGRITALAVAAQLRAQLLAHLLVARPGGVPETAAPASSLRLRSVGSTRSIRTSRASCHSSSSRPWSRRRSSGGSCGTTSCPRS